MPARSKVMTLPESVKEELDKRLVKSGFGNYEGLSDWLTEQGYGISSSTLHRYGQDFEAKLDALRIATHQAQAISEAVGDDENALGDALVRLAQEKAFQVLMKFNAEDVEGLDLVKMSRAIADLNRSAVQQKKWMGEIRAKAAEVAEEVGKEVRDRGMSDSLAEQLVQKVLGIVA
ncbi:MAG: DUF3486 family protein [Cyanobacteria bacterium P01_F01_bin.56]